MANKIDLATYSANFELDDSGLKTGLANADKTLKNESTKFGKWFKVGLAGTMAAVTAAIGAEIKKSAESFMDFQNGMNQVFTLLPDISEQAMGEMGDQVKQLSKDMGVLPDEVIPALYQSLSASVPEDNVFEFLETAQKGAIAGITETETVVDGLTTVLNSYHMEATEADKISDILFTTIKYGKTSMEELSGSMSQVTPIASTLGVDFEDIGAALATMTAQGANTATSATQLRQMFAELSKEGTKTSDTFKEIAGKSFKDFIAEGHNVSDALQLMEGYAKANGLEINDLFGSIQAGQAALMLTGESAEMFANNLDNMSNSAGATDQAFGTMENSVARNIDKIKANMEIMREELGESLAPVLANVTDYIVEAMPTIQNIIQVTFDVVGDVISVFVDVLDWLTDNIQNLVANNEESFTEMKDTISNIFAEMKEIIQTFVDIAKSIWDKYGENLLAITQNIWNAIKDVFQGVLKIIEGILMVFGGLLTGDWEQTLEGLKIIASGAWQAIKSIFTNGVEIIKNIVSMAGTALKNIATTVMDLMWQGFKFVWDKITGWFGDVFSSLFNWFGGLGSKFTNIGRDMLNWVWDGMKGIWTSITNWVSNTVNWLADKLAFWRRSKTEMEQPVAPKGSKLPSYDIGTKFVPSDQIALIHKGEAIIPAKYNPFNPNNNSTKTRTKVEKVEKGDKYDIHIDKVVTDDARSFIDELPTLVHQYKG